MITRCDHCGSKFEVSAELVNSSDPGVRCGECLSLFDARANLFNEAEYRKTAATLKPVQRRKAVVKEAEVVDADMLETADTVAVEHIYTSAGLKNRAYNYSVAQDSITEGIASKGIASKGLATEGAGGEFSNYDADLAEIDQHYRDSGSTHRAKNQADHQPGLPGAYRTDNKYPSDVEFERTLASESALPERADISDRVDSQLADGSDSRLFSQNPVGRDNRRDNRGSTDFDHRDLVNRELADRDQVNPDKANPDQANSDQANRDKTHRELVDHDLDRQSAGNAVGDSVRHDTDQRKQQTLRDREQRALQIEPERDFGALSSVDVALEQSRLDESREEAFARRGASQGSPIDDSDLARDTRVVNRGDTHFIPDDVLNQPEIIRDNGRRQEAATRFKEDTPEFDISLDDDQPDTAIADRYAVTSREQIEPEKSAPEKPELEKAEIKAPESERLDRLQPQEEVAVPQHSSLLDNTPATADLPTADVSSGDLSSDVLSRTSEQGADHLIADSDVQVKSEGYETSAQEMRSFKQNFPTVDSEVIEESQQEADHADEEHMVQNSTRTVTQTRSGAASLFWMAGLILAVGLLLFAARGFIANMSLPEPVVAAFCQVTGCVPDEAKKNVDQLQTVRTRLYPHPEIDDAIVISVDVINNSIYKQPLPTLAVSLLDEDDQIIAERDFSTADYEIVDGSESGFLMPDEPTRLKIEVVDTGLGAADVELAFE